MLAKHLDISTVLAGTHPWRAPRENITTADRMPPPPERKPTATRGKFDYSLPRRTPR